MVFTRLLDFIYTDLFKGMMYGNIPKRCKLCGRYFLQEKGVGYEYCSEIAPGKQTKTCRDVGATNSFRDKVHNNEIWQAHQRAYKKYYARVLKHKMPKPDFNVWAIASEQLRNDALERSAVQLGGFDFNAYVRELNSVE
jgi:hypothetical protein